MLLAFTLGVLCGNFALIMRVRRINPLPLEEVQKILRRIEAAEDLLREYIEGGRMQVSSSGDQVIHMLGELTRLLRHHFFTRKDDL